MWVRKTLAQRRIYRCADVFGQTRHAWTGVQAFQAEVGGTAPSSCGGVGGGGGVGAGKVGGRGVAEVKTVPGRARPLVVVGGGLTRLEVEVDEADVEAEAKRVSRLTLL